MRKFFLAALFGISMVSPVMAKGTFQDHVRLSEAVQSTGTTFRINPKRCDSDNFYGWAKASYELLSLPYASGKFGRKMGPKNNTENQY